MVLPRKWVTQCESGLPWEFTLSNCDTNHLSLGVKPCIGSSGSEEVAVKARVSLSSPMACDGISAQTFTHEWKLGKNSEAKVMGFSKFFPKNVLSDPRCATTFFRATVEVLLD